ncbi:MAG: hypothetical protein JSV99_03060, partial [Planctomycetota bacterium]
MYVFICLGQVCDFHIWAVVVELFVHHAQGNVSKQDELGQWTCVVEVRAGRPASLAGVDPFGVVSRRARNRLRRSILFFHFRFPY